MENYKYILNYLNDENKVYFEINANLTLEQLEEYLTKFLLACGWSERQLQYLFKKEDEEDV